MDEGSLYESDIVAWADEQAREIRALASRPDLSNVLDWAHLAEEIESLGKSQVAAARSKLRLILVHLIKIITDADADSRHHWRAEIVAFQDVASVEFTNAMRGQIDLQRVWASAVREADEALAGHGRRVSRRLPTACPFSVDDLVSDSFEIDAALGVMSKAMAPSRG